MEMSIGKVIKMPCMRSGLCKYPNETILVSKQTLELMAPTSMGIPVVIDHPDIPVTDATIGELPVVGRVADMHYDDENEHWLAHFVIDDTRALELLKQGYGISTAWYGEKYTGGGTFNNLPYDREVVSARYEHIAIVASPRYEIAVGPVFMNSADPDKIDGHDGQNAVNIKQALTKEGGKMLSKVWKKLTSREDFVTNAGEEIMVDIDGQDKPLSEVIELARHANKKNADEEKKDEEKKEAKVNGEDKVDVDGENMTINDLVAAYKDFKKASKKNADEEKEDEEKKKENEEETDAEKKKEEKDDKKENSTDEDPEVIAERFNALDDAHKNGLDVVDGMGHLSLYERMAMGQKRYGSNK